MAVNPGRVRRAEVETDADTSGRSTTSHSTTAYLIRANVHFTRKDPVGLFLTVLSSENTNTACKILGSSTESRGVKDTVF